MSSAFAGQEQEQPVWDLKESDLQDLRAFLDTQHGAINPTLTDLRTAPPPAEYSELTFEDLAANLGTGGDLASFFDFGAFDAQAPLPQDAEDALVPTAPPTPAPHPLHELLPAGSNAHILQNAELLAQYVADVAFGNVPIGDALQQANSALFAMYEQAYVPPQQETLVQPPLPAPAPLFHSQREALAAVSTPASSPILRPQQPISRELSRRESLVSSNASPHHAALAQVFPPMPPAVPQMPPPNATILQEGPPAAFVDPYPQMEGWPVPQQYLGGELQVMMPDVNNPPPPMAPVQYASFQDPAPNQYAALPQAQAWQPERALSRAGSLHDRLFLPDPAYPAPQPPTPARVAHRPPPLQIYQDLRVPSPITNAPSSFPAPPLLPPFEMTDRKDAPTRTPAIAQRALAKMKEEPLSPAVFTPRAGSPSSAGPSRTKRERATYSPYSRKASQPSSHSSVSAPPKQELASPMMKIDLGSSNWRVLTGDDFDEKGKAKARARSISPPPFSKTFTFSSTPAPTKPSPDQADLPQALTPEAATLVPPMSIPILPDIPEPSEDEMRQAGFFACHPAGHQFEQLNEQGKLMCSCGGKAKDTMLDFARHLAKETKDYDADRWLCPVAGCRSKSARGDVMIRHVKTRAKYDASHEVFMRALEAKYASLSEDDPVKNVSGHGKPDGLMIRRYSNALSKQQGLI